MSVLNVAHSAAIFAVNTGISWGGVALAPIIGAQLIRYTGDLLSVFYVSLAANAFVLFMFTCVVPESLAPADRANNKKKLAEERSKQGPRRMGVLLDLVRPLKVFWPRRSELGKRDWNLSVVGLAYFLVSIGTVRSALTYIRPSHASQGYALFLMQLGQRLWGWDSEMARNSCMSEPWAHGVADRVLAQPHWDLSRCVSTASLPP